MATKSFLKDIAIKDSASARSFVSALKNADNKGRKKVVISKKIETIKDSERIKEIFKTEK